MLPDTSIYTYKYQLYYITWIIYVLLTIFQNTQYQISGIIWWWHFIFLINIKSFIRQLCLWVLYITHPTPGTLHMVVWSQLYIVKIIPDKLYIYRLMLEYHKDWDSCDSSEISAAELTPIFMSGMATTQTRVVETQIHYMVNWTQMPTLSLIVCPWDRSSSAWVCSSSPWGAWCVFWEDGGVYG